jgi:hypothetical protein
VPGVSGQAKTITVTGASVTLSFAGMPGYAYSVQRSLNLTSWTSLTVITAPTNGLFQYTDTFSDLGSPPTSAFYRLERSQ